MRCFSVIFFLLLISPAAHGDDSMAVQLVRVIDGDTIVVNVAGWPEIIGREIGVRISGCDTPELRDKRPSIRALAQKAKAFVQARLQGAVSIRICNIRRGKYFRIVADVCFDGHNLGALLIEHRLAKPYDGGRKPRW